jgi:hypothetical protein
VKLPAAMPQFASVQHRAHPPGPGPGTSRLRGESAPGLRVPVRLVHRLGVIVDLEEGHYGHPAAALRPRRGAPHEARAHNQAQARRLG